MDYMTYAVRILANMPESKLKKFIYQYGNKKTIAKFEEELANEAAKQETPQDSLSDDGLLSLQECATLVDGMTVNKVRNLVKTGRIPFVRDGESTRSRIRINKDEFLAYINAPKPTKKPAKKQPRRDDGLLSPQECADLVKEMTPVKVRNMVKTGKLPYESIGDGPRPRILIKKDDFLACVKESKRAKKSKSAQSKKSTDMLTVKECTELVEGLTEQKVRYLINKDKVPYTRNGDGPKARFLIMKKDLLAYFSPKKQDKNKSTPATADPDLLTPKEAAAMSDNLTEVKVRYLVKTGKLPCVRKGEGKKARILIRKDAMQMYLDSVTKE